jgi:hypothetical protein
MRRAQGNTRAAPDGFLSLWNHAATKGSGLAGALYNYVLSERHRDIVEAALIELSEKQPVTFPTSHFKHDNWRFHKDFLMLNFKPVVYGTFKLLHRNASELMAIAINREYLLTDKIKVQFPTN